MMRRALLLCAVAFLGLTGTAQAAGGVTGTLDCTSATLTYAGFPDPQVNYRIVVDGKASDGQLTFNHKAVLKVPVPLADPFSHQVSVFSWWAAQVVAGVSIPAGGSETVALATAQCGAGSPPPPQACPTCRSANTTVCKKCVSRRVLPIRIIELGRRYRSATVTLAGRATRAVRRNGRLVARIDFRGLDGPEVYVATIRAVTTSGRVVTGRRLYRVCTPKDDATVNFDETRL